jgi:hypothetical protein
MGGVCSNHGRDGKFVRNLFMKSEEMRLLGNGRCQIVRSLLTGVCWLVSHVSVLALFQLVALCLSFAEGFITNYSDSRGMRARYQR